VQFEVRAIYRTEIIGSRLTAPLIARVLVRFDHIARLIVNANHSIMWGGCKGYIWTPGYWAWVDVGAPAVIFGSAYDSM